MKQVIIGTFYLGLDSVELVLREGSGGEFYFFPEKGHIPRIKIGTDYGKWNEVVEVLLHETMEFAFTRMNCRFSTEPVSKNHDRFLFVANHPQFSEICAEVAEFIAVCLPKLAAEWKKFKKEQR